MVEKFKQAIDFIDDRINNTFTPCNGNYLCEAIKESEELGFVEAVILTISDLCQDDIEENDLLFFKKEDAIHLGDNVYLIKESKLLGYYLAHNEDTEESTTPA